MPATPWRSCQQPDPSREYVVLLSFLPLKRRRRIPLLLISAFRIVRQLRRSSGLIAYSLYTELTSARFWTVSVWESESALQAFVHASPHADAMRALIPHMGRTRFVRWTVSGAGLPISWDEALRR